MAILVVLTTPECGGLARAAILYWDTDVSTGGNNASASPNLAWNTNTLATDGTLRVVSTVPVLISNTVSESLLTLFWPADHIGRRLQAQANSVSAGLSTNWLESPNSAVTNQMAFPLDPAAGSVFYRLLFP